MSQTAPTEGDYVPGKGILMPDGTYRATKAGDMGDTTGDAVMETASTKKDTTGPKVSPDDMWANAAKTGISKDIYSKLNSTQQATVAALGESVGILYSSGSTGVTVDDALKAAAQDPNINAKYADSLNLDQAEFSQGLTNIQAAVSTEATNNRIQFENDRKALAEASASAGTAYSGFRGQAQKNLADTESGIVTSSRSKAQKELDQLKQNFASKWGSAATPSASISAPNAMLTPSVGIDGTRNTGYSPDPILTGNAPANLTGTQPISKQQDINTKASDLYSVGQLPNL